MTDGLTGLAVGIAAGAATDLACRAWYVSRLFEGFAFARHALRGILPAVPALAVVLAIRALETGPRTEVIAAAELATFVGVTVLATCVLESSLLGEVRGYLWSYSRPAAAQ
jgi:UDP-N-acetylmuramyl pentapeptide phosphotransferase/UDP-N-acetylglucosamine-1-phosphate transferase